MRRRGRPSAAAAAYLVLAALLLLLLSHYPSQPSPRRPHRRLKLRLGGPPSDPRLRRPIAFDPVVAEIENRLEDSDGEGLADEEDYLNDEARFNVTDRLASIFPRLDVGPADGFVDRNELAEWILRSSEREMIRRTAREMDAIDLDGDGFVSFEEFKPSPWVRKSRNILGDVGWWKDDHFNASDIDGDGLLDMTEFNDFLHPADTRSPKLLRWLCTEDIREKDTDEDGKLNFEEFFQEIFDLIRDYEVGFNGSHTTDFLKEMAKKLFSDLDYNKDGFLSEEELLPVLGKIYPSERSYAKQQADYLLQQSDKDKDGRLSLQEMITDPYVFYSSIFEEEEDDDYPHTEFR